MDAVATTTMTLLLSAAALQARRTALADPTALDGLALSLQRELHAALDVPVPEGKSRLTRHNGRCPTCTVLLAFDPRSPRAHPCPSCGRVYTDAVHHEWWLMNAHLWTAEQSTRAAALAYLLDDSRAAARADEILVTYAERYLRWPNQDNALGPTRPFFSTYLESIWLLHLCVALDLREAAGQFSYSDVLRVQLVQPSAALIASFPEGRSNREVWHVAARLAAAQLLDDAAMRDAAAESLRTLLRTGLHSDGSWYEGENYHLFAHRGLLSAVTLAEQAGVEIPAELMARFEMGFAAPFRTMLPDGTFPSRRDSQYGISLRQYRTADWLECGIARRDTPELRAALAMMYDPSAHAGETGRALSTADAERNQRGVRLTRADCSWRTLLLGRLELPSLTNATPQSELLQGQGLAVFRRNAGRFWVGLDYGDPGAGHGHPDRLNLVIATDTHRWLDDVGTGSYTSPTLAWYRSSMAHNAPMVNGKDQGATRGRLLAHDEAGETGWVSAEFIDPVSQVRFVRTVVVTDDHVLDELTWEASGSVVVDLPMQARPDARDTAAWTAILPASDQDQWLKEPVQRDLSAGSSATLTLTAQPTPTRDDLPDATVHATVWTESPAVVWAAETVGRPAGRAAGLVSLRQSGTRGRSLRVFALDGSRCDLVVDDGEVAVFQAESPYATVHRRTAEGWSVRGGLHGARTSLTGRREPRAERPEDVASPTRICERIVCTEAGDGRWQTTLVLGARSYRPTEVRWTDAREPSADVTVATEAGTGAIEIRVDVMLHRAPLFAPPVADNPLDNEHPDTNSDGVQLHWRSVRDAGWNSVLAVPDERSGEVRLSVIEGHDDGVTAQFQLTARGYRLDFDLPWPDAATPFEFDLIVNERPPGRERRRGQLVLSGANGESAYLRGARQDAERALTILFQHPSS